MGASMNQSQLTNLDEPRLGDLIRGIAAWFFIFLAAVALNISLCSAFYSLILISAPLLNGLLVIVYGCAIAAVSIFLAVVILTNGDPTCR